MKKISILFLVTLFAQLISAATIYVSPTGSDSNNGLSPSTPFRTINQAVSYAVNNGGPANNNVILMNGTWTDITINNNAACANWTSNLVIQGENSNVLVNGIGVECPHITIKGIKVSTIVSNRRPGHFCNVEDVESVGYTKWSITASNITWLRCTATDYFDFPADVVRIAAEGNIASNVPRNILIEDCCFSGSSTSDGNHIDVIQTIGVVNVTFKNCKITHAPTGLFMPTKVGDVPIDSTIFENCYFGDGRLYTGHNNDHFIVRNCVIDASIDYTQTIPQQPYHEWTGNKIRSWTWSIDAMPTVFENNIVGTTTWTLPPSNTVDPNIVLPEPACPASSDPVAVTGVSVSPSTLALNVGQSSDLTETVLPASATNKNVIWSSSNTSVATVNAGGLVTVVGAGNATITVTTVDGGFTDQCSVTATQINGIASSSTWQSFTESTQTGEFTATFDATPNGSNIDALTGIQNGTASAYGDLACIVRFNTSGQIDARNGGSYTSSNTINYASGIDYHFRIEINVPSHTYSVFVTPEGDSEQTVASDFAFRTEQAGVSQLTGWSVYAVSGSHIVDNMSFSADVPVTSVSASPGTLSLTEGETSDLTETVSPANATNKNVTWSSSATSIATVDANGLVTAVSAGNATITVTTVDGSFTDNCAVTVSSSGGSSTNIALNKPVSVDSEYNGTYVGENAVDGNNTDNANRWVSANSSYPHWIEIDLQGTFAIEQVNFWTGYNGYGYPVEDYQIQYWTGSAWADVVNVTGNSNAVVTHTFTSVETNSIRLYATAGSVDNILRLYEIEVLGTEATPSEPVTLNPIADSYVRGGTYANNNYGTDNIMYVRYNSANETYTREGFLKFDLSGISGSVASATLRLYVASTNASSTQTVSLVSNDSWTETGITYANKPSSGSAINTWNVTTAGNYVETDITSAVNAESGGLLSLHVTGDGSYIGYDSREGSNKPELYITFGGASNANIVSKEQSLEKNNPTLSIYPNPSIGSNVTIRIPGYNTKLNTFLKVIDMTGKQVYVERLTNELTQLNTSNLSKGIYLVMVNNETYTEQIKLVLQ